MRGVDEWLIDWAGGIGYGGQGGEVEGDSGYL